MQNTTEKSSRSAEGLYKFFIYFVLVLLAVTIIVPVAWVFMASIKQNAEFYGNPWALPAGFYWQNFVNAWNGAKMGEYMLNSVIVTALALALLLMLAAAAAAYFLGCFNGAVIVSKYILRDDVRKHGSGNAGLTNFYRTFGGPLTVVVILTDVLKAVAAVLVGMVLFRVIGTQAMETAGKYWAGTFCLLGHMFPCMFKFKGGKGILSGGTIALMVDWRIALVVWGGFLVLAILTKWVSLGSIWAGASFPFAIWFVCHDLFTLLLAAACGALVVWKHRGNLKRILAGTESKFSFHRKKEGERKP